MCFYYGFYKNFEYSQNFPLNILLNDDFVIISVINAVKDAGFQQQDALVK